MGEPDRRTPVAPASDSPSIGGRGAICRKGSNQTGVQKEAYTEDEYFEFERRAFGRWEFVPTGPPAPDGRRLGDIRAMSGGTGA